MNEESKFLNRSLVERLHIVAKARFDLIFAAVSAFGGSLTTYLFSIEEVPKWVSGLTIFIWLVVLFTLILFKIEKEQARAGREVEILKRKELDEKIKAERKDEAINLTDRTLSYSSKSLRFITEELRVMSQIRTKIPVEIEKNEEYTLKLKNRILRQICRDLRSVFEGDARGIDTTDWPHNFFKIALFEPEPTPENATHLRRTFFDYPEGIDPSPETEIFNIVQHARSAVVLAFLQQSIVVIEDIKTENRKSPGVKRWINRRENQADEYESMICVSIVSGIRDQSHRKCLGVLVIDTNRERYFQEDRSFQAFLGNLLNPFRTTLTLSLELNDYSIVK